MRENLFGGQRELLLASNIAKELKVESVGGYLYWSTGFSVKSSKLNGKEQQSYYTADYFSGKKGIYKFIKGFMDYSIVIYYSEISLFLLFSDVLDPS